MKRRQPEQRGGNTSKGPLRLETLERRVLFSADLPFVADALGSSDPSTAPIVGSTVTGNEVDAESQQGQPLELVIIDPSAADFGSVLEEAEARSDSGFQAYLLSPDDDGLAQLSEILTEHRNVSALHLVTAGTGSEIALGGSTLTLMDMLANADEVAGWGESFATESSWQIYGSGMADSDEGLNFVTTLSDLTGADVAVSSELTVSAWSGPVTTDEIPEAKAAGESNDSDAEVRLELVFIDTDTPDYEQLLDDLLANDDSSRNIEVVVLDQDKDGIEEISEFLSHRDDLDAIHIISHGSDGNIQLGNTSLNSETLADNNLKIALWADSFAETGDILIYGCNLASTEVGQSLIEDLGELTLTDVAASDDLTGHESLGGDWDLEHQVGDIESTVAVSLDAQVSYRQVLAEFTVDTTDDTNDVNLGNGVAEDGSGNTSLRAAIEEANALGGADTITLGAGNFDLSLGTIIISSDVTIVGAGPDLTVIDAQDLNRVFAITGGTVSISGVTLQNGAAGAGDGGGVHIANSAVVSMSDVLLTGNDGHFGGAIWNDGTLTLDGVTLDLNNGSYGGGLYNRGNATVTDSTISNNTATNGGAGEGGGVWTSGAGNTLDLTNVTISGNSTDGDGGGLYNGKDATLTNVTITNNQAADGAGIHDVGNAATTTLTNTLVAGNGTPGQEDLSGNYTSGGNNLIGIDGPSTGLTDGVNGDQVGTAGSPIDPMLGALADNGGSTQTHALQTGSSAIDSGTNTGAPTTDQRGYIETDATMDIGAYQYGAVAPSISVGLQVHHTYDVDASDASGNNRDGILSDNAAVDTNTGTNRVGDGKLILDGTNDYVNLNTHAAGMAGYTEGAIGAWINTSAGTQQTIFSLGDTAGSSFARLYLQSDGSLRWTVSEAGSTTVDVTSNAAFNDGNWHHVAVTVGSSGNSLWVDGVELTVAAATYSNGSAASTNFFDDLSGVAQAEVGAYELSGTMYDEFSGLIDDFRIYDRTLTAGDIGELQNPWVYGTPGDDVIAATAGNDQIDALGGNDTIDYSGAAGPVTVDLTSTAAQNTGGSGIDTLLGFERVIGSSGNDSFQFGNPANGAAYQVDGNTGSNTIDLSGYASSAVTFGNGTMTVDMGGGQLFTIDYVNIDTIDFLDVSANVLTNDIALTNWSGDAIFIDADETFRLSLTGGGTMDWGFVRGTDTLTVTGTTGTDVSSALVIDDLNGTDLSIDQITVSADIGAISSDADIGTIAFANDVAVVTTIQADVGSIDITGDVASDLTIQGDVGPMSMAKILGGATLHVTGSVGPVTLTSDISGTLQVDGNMTSLTMNKMQPTGVVTVGGDVTSIDTFDVSGPISITGNLGSWTMGKTQSDLTITIGGNVGTIGSGDELNADIIIGGDLDSANFNSVNSAATVTANQVIGTLVFDVGGTDYGGTYANPVVYVFDGATQTPSTTLANDAPTFIDGAFGNWNFDEGSGDSVAEGAVGISTATLGSTTGADANDPTWTTGMFGQALQFDGVDDYVEIADAPGIDISGPEFSASLWVKPDRGPGTEDMFFMKGDRQGTGNVNYYLSWKDSGKMTWAFKSDGGFEYIDIDVTLPTVDEWNHVAVVFDRPTVSIYINGTEYTSSVATGGTMDKDLVANDDPLWIGAGRDGGSLVTPGNFSAPFSGAIDELALFDRALTAAEVEAIRTSAPPVVTASEFTVDENSANNTVVGTVVANDPDVGDTLSYAITAGNTNGAFAIDNNGIITVANYAALDFETTPVFNLTVEATDDGAPNLSDTISVSVTLNDVNDDPVFTSPASFSVAENSTAVGTVTNTDVDGGAPQYSLVGAVDDGLFSIDVNSGALSFNAAPDFEAPSDSGGDNVYDLTVQVDDGNGGIVNQAVTVTVSDANEIGITAISDNDAAPETVAENASPGATVGITAFADDADATDTVSYSLDDDAGGLFSIDTNTGVVTLAGGLDYETATSHDIAIRATSTDTSFTTRTFTIAVGDVNDTAPVVTAAQTFSINEDAVLNDVVGTVAATDVDTGGSLQGWAITAGNTDGIFQINGTTGQITIADPSNLNYEATPQYTLTVQVSDGVNTSATETVVIDVNDVNEAPVFDSTPVTTATEDAAYSYTITTSDVDGDTLSINGLTVPAWLTLTDNGDGTATFTGTPTNAEVGPHSVSLEVTDGALTATQNFTLTVNGDPTFTSPASFTVPENTTAVGTVTSTDVDGGAPQYTLVGAVDDGLFSIDVNSGALSFNAAPDFEAPADSGGDNVYNLTVQVNDGNGGIVSQAITVTVADVNETPVDILVTGSTTGGLSLNNDGGNDTYLVADSGLATPLTQFTFEVQFEGSNGSTEVPFISYNTPSGDIMSINTMSNNTLELDIGTGSVVFSSAVDYNATLMDGQRHTLSVSWDNSAGDWAVYIDGSLIDNGTGLSTGQTIPTGGTLMFGLEQDSVGGNFESHEYFNGTLFDIRLFDDVRTAEEIATHQRETLANTEPNLLANWTLDELSTDGVITENVSGNNLTVQHHSGTGFSASTPVLQLTVRDDAVDGTAIGNVSATDPDTGETFTYALTDTASGRFAISNGGEISVADASQIDYAINTSHDITIRVTDSGGLTYDKVFTILVTGNEAPVFDSTPVTAATEDVAYSYTVTTSDVDGDVLSINGLTVPAWLTLTDNGDGTATLSGTPTNAEVGDHSVNLEVSDGALTATQSFTLTVSNVNDDPVFTSPTSFSVAENLTAVGTVTSTDVDGGAPQYTLVGAVDDGLFSIDINSGALSFNAAPDFEAPSDSGGDNVYNLTVQVDDGNGGIVNQAISVTVTNVNESGASAIVDNDGTADAISEDATVGTTVGITAFADDADATDTVSYSLDDDAGGLFTIDTNSGVVTVAGALDYESATNHDITVRATSTDASFTTRTFTIAVGDVNDNAPVVTAAQTFNINEDAVLNDVVGTVVATDADTVGTLQGWTITAGNTDGIFQIDGTTGEITIADPSNLNYEVTPQYTLTVQVSDGVNTSASETLVIDIVDVNEAPTFTSAPLTTATEDALYSYTITTSDVDGDVLSINGLTVPAWLTLTDNGDGTATLTGTPTNAEVGDHSVSLEVSDGSLTATQSFTLTVSNVNDDPVFTSPTSFSVAENLTAVGTVTSTDVDGGAPQYTLVGAVDDGLFSIDVNSGVLSFNTAPDFEAPTDTGSDNVYDLTVQVDDGNGGIVTQAVSVTVTNINETPVGPIGDIDATGDAVAEGAIVGTTVGITANATDSDAGDTVTYSLDDDAGGLFTIDTNTGVVTVAGALDYETASSHSITVRATSTDTSFTTQSFTIAIGDVNDTAPVVTAAQTFNVNEDAVLNDVVGTVAATDVDTVGSLQGWTITAGNADGIFAINASTGQITIADPTNLDFEATPQHTLTVQVSDGVNTSTTETVVIDVNDVNEAPVFDSTPVTAATEDVAYSYTITTSDVDGDVLSINGLTVPAWLTLTDNGDGTATLSGTPTNSEVGDHSVSLEVSDGSLTATQSFTLTVSNVNDDPVFTSPTSFSVAENLTAVGTVTSTDVDGGAPQYTLVGAVDDGLFSIDVNSGVLSFNTAPDFEAPTDTGGDNVYDLTVQVDDGNGGIVNQTISVTVTNVNESGITAISDTDAALETVAEDASPGTAVGLTAFADDADATDTVSYSLDDDASGLFSIDTNSGVVTVNGALDYETASSHNITVRATSTDGSFSTWAFSIAVSDVNETGITAISDTDATLDTVAEDALPGTSVGITAFADDADGTDTVSYSLDDDAGGLFTVDTLTGAVTVNAALDYESSTSHNIILRGTSTDGSTTTRAFTIGISDVNDSAPVVTPAHTFNVNEDAVLNDVVGTVVATDADTVGTLQGWTITAGNTDGIFQIDGTTGEITIADPSNLNYEVTPQYTLTVQVSDGVNTSASETLVIDIVDVNEAPVFDSTPVTAATEDVAYSYTITTSDVDGDLLSINGLTVPAWLTLTDNGDGTATLSGTPTNAEVGDHSVSLEVSDGALTATQSFTLTVSNVNDDPVFTSPASFSVAENVTAVGTVTSTDVDGGAPQYTLVGAVDDGLFSIDVNSGALSFNAAPDFESPADTGGDNVYDLTVQVNDGNGGIVNQAISVTVTNVNESGASAIVDNDGTADAINEDATIGTAVGITAFADDADATDTVSYSLDDDAGGLFTIDASTGIVTVAGALDYEITTSHDITVRATSTDTSFSTRTFSIAVDDVNDNAPVVTAAQTFNINEDAVLNDVVGTVVATDADTVGTLQGWTITAGNTDGIFQIDGTTGEITIADPSNLNYEVTPQYTLTVQVSDGVNTSASETLVTDIVDVNEAPVFDSTPVTAATEDVAYSYTITTSDVDGDTLSINGLTVPAWLTLTDNGDGTATLTGTPTNAEVGDHSVNLEVSDGALTATQSFTLTVSNVNDDPVFTSPASFSVAENVTAVGSVTSTDVDGGAPQYTLVGAVDDGLFSIDINSGALSFNAAPDFESPADSGGDNVYDLTVQVDDGNGGIVNQAISVTVTNVNESGASAIADNDGTADAVSEDAAIGAAIGITAFADDADSGDTVSYSLDDDAGGLFVIDGSTGVVTLSGALDYETTSSHDITVRATSTDTSFTTRTFSIAVGDVNDTAPVVTAAQTFNVNEDAVLNDVVGTVVATDVDTVGSLQGWTITSGNADGIFQINGTTGQITIADPTNLNFEATPQYTLTVQVGDGVYTSATETVVINVNDINEAPNLPILSVATVDENTDTSAGYTVGTLSAPDVDAGDMLTFEVVGGLDSDVFSIGGLNGDELIIDDGLLDHERQSNYEVRIRVTDSGGLSSERNFTITVNDLNDAPLPGADVLNVMEDTALVIDLAADLLANDQDPDGDPLTVVGMTQPANGVLMDNLDGTWTYLANANYTGPDQFQYQVSDASGAIASAIVSIDVLPVNDNPMLSMPDSMSVGENTTGPVTAVQASDVDGDPISLQLGGADSGSFTLDAATGEIRFNSAPDFEGPADASGDNQYQLQVTASDGAGGSVSLPISIDVSDVNEAPELLSTDFTSVQGFSGSVGSLRFSDPDVGDQVQITAVGGSGANLFSVDPTSGEITQSGDSLPGVYTLDVQLTDSQGATATGTLTITLGSLDSDPETSIIKLISETDPDPYNEIIAIGTVQEDESSTENTQQASDEPVDESRSEAPGTDAPGRASSTDAAFAGQAVAGGQTDVEASSTQPQRLPGQSGSYSRGAHTMVLELLLEETDELVEIAFGGTVDRGFDLSRTSLSLSPSMLSALEEMRANVDTVADQDEEQADLLVQTGAVATLSLTAGFVTWLLRTGSLLATVLSTSPLWRPFDPIPVLVDLEDASRPDLGEDVDEA